MRGKTHHFQPPTGQNSLRRRRNTTSVALQIPHDLTGAELREHLRYLLDLGWVDGASRPTATAAWPGLSPITIKEPSKHEE